MGQVLPKSEHHKQKSKVRMPTAGTHIPELPDWLLHRKQGGRGRLARSLFVLFIFAWPFIECLSQTKLALTGLLLCYLFCALGKRQ